MLSGGNVHHGGHRDGQHAVGTADAAGALVQHGDDDVLDAQIVQAYGRSGDVHDGIHRADFVKVHGFQRGTVGLCLGLAQNGKDAHGRGAGAVGQIGFVQDVQHLGQPAVYVVMVAVSVFVDMFMVVAMFSLVVVAAMPMAVVVVLVMVVLMHIVGVAALLHPAVQIGHIVVVVLVLGVLDAYRTAAHLLQHLFCVHSISLSGSGSRSCCPCGSPASP